MTKTEVTFCCGHTGIVYLSGTDEEQEAKKERIQEERLCPECYLNASKEFGREAERVARDMKMPELSGSEKQVVWAVAIRHKLILEIDQFMRGMRLNISQEGLEELIGKIQWAFMEQHTDAAFWIDNRTRWRTRIEIQALCIDLINELGGADAVKELQKNGN